MTDASVTQASSTTPPEPGGGRVSCVPIPLPGHQANPRASNAPPGRPTPGLVPAKDNTSTCYAPSCSIMSMPDAVGDGVASCLLLHPNLNLSPPSRPHDEMPSPPTGRSALVTATTKTGGFLCVLVSCHVARPEPVEQAPADLSVGRRQTVRACGIEPIPPIRLAVPC